MNHNFQLLQTLYSSTFGKYLKFKHRFDKAVQSGKFRKLTKRKQSSIVSRLRKLYERLKSLQTQLKFAGAGAALSLAAALSNPVSAQELGPFNRNDAANPLPPPYVINNPRIAMVDIDNDGDLDSFVGNSNGDIKFFRNDSPEGTVRRFIEVTGSANPLDGVNKGSHAAPAFADIDGDGDMDMLLGVINPIYNPPGGPNQYDYSPTFFFKNTGTATNPVFTEQTGASNPFNGFYGAKYGPSIPIFVDIDGDGDMDLFMGGSFSSDPYGANPAVQYYENQGSATAPNFVATSHPLATAITSFDDVGLSFVDFDGDDDLDAFVGVSYSGYGLRAFRNDGSTFTELTGANNPTRYINMPFASPVFADIDGDDDMDLVVGNTYYNRPSVFYFENTGGFSLHEKNDLNLSPFGGVDVGNDAAPVFVDIDNDGDLDAMIGSKYSGVTLSVFINEDGLMVADPTHPLYDIFENGSIVPVFVDIDDDGDMDLFSGGRQISFFRNTGTASNPEFLEEEISFPTLTASNTYDMSITFIDIDNDGDQDAFIGNDRYNQVGVLFFENTGSASEPDFTKAEPPAPFDNDELFEENPNIVAVDLDNDGDLDLIITETYYAGNESYASRTRFFSNYGAEGFSEVDGSIISYVSPKSITAFADIDGDGDLDAFVGNGDNFGYNDDGRITYFENDNPPPATEVSLNTVSVSLNTPAILDPDLNISDDDDDDIVLATVTISNYTEGNEVLDFTPSSGVTGEFENGVLTIRGRAQQDQYETILRTVTYTFTGNVTSARMSSNARALGVPPQSKTVTFSVRDVDFTQTVVSQVNVITLNLIGEPEAGITVYNAVSPGVSTGLNDFMRITGLPTDNKVSIFNRWGDKVFEVSGYDNVDKRFEGKNDNGKELPTGTYYYLIELKDRKINGYLSLRR